RAVDLSNVMLVCKSCGKPTRIGKKVEGDKKIRICKKCGAEN
ncbi:MAG: 50S ribosomal protein L24, partial [Patescibacteria group bacterium]